MASSGRGASLLLAFARELQKATTFEELLLTAQVELVASVGYSHAWLFVAETPDAEELRLIDAAGARAGMVREHAPLLKVRGDAMLEEMIASDAPVVVLDARTDPRTNKEIVAALGNRTIINVPLRLIDKPFGAFGTGTFADEGCRPPSHDDLEYLIGMGAHLAIAAGRIRFTEERRVAEIALRRSDNQLQQAQKMDAVGRLAGGVAHDFNNLLSVILSYAALAISDHGEIAPLRHDLEQIVRAGERAAELTKQLLLFSREQVIEPQILDLNAVISNMARMLRRVISEDIELVVVPAQSLGRVRADPGKLDEVLLNLAMNARDAMPTGGKLVLETANVELDQSYADGHLGVVPGAYAALSVSDTGTGMTRVVREKIFEPFFTTKGLGKGTGLGLATAYGIVRQAGGHISVYSELGEGTTFRVYLPRVEMAEDRPRPLSPSVTTLRGSETVLLAEDDEHVRVVVQGILERNGYVVIAAAGGQEALVLAEQHTDEIDLLLTDVIMTTMNGGQLAARLVATRPGLRVLYMSGYTGGALESQRALEGEVLLLQKPVTPDALLRKVREALRES